MSQKENDNNLMKIVAIIILIFWSLTWLLILLKPEIRGTIGDMFGVVNSLFSGFAFLGVIYAILLQRTELALQREELSLTRGELEKSANAQEKSEEALRMQAEAMAKTATINILTASLSSLEKRAGGISLSGPTKEVEVRKKKKAKLQNKAQEIIRKLDRLVDESLVE
ncbi:hypothetical protein ACIGBN_05705 [Marinomonas sp. NPDC078689]|uniref:hypothetical protein n=1 Tax=Marinomonas sp. NPDC078689 TaxID=3364147 RepID=UPI0037CB5A77